MMIPSPVALRGRWPLRIGTFVLPLLLSIGCSRDGISPQPIVSLVVTPQNHTVGIGRTMPFSAYALTVNGDTLHDVEVTWRSADSTIVQVRHDGIAQALQAGTTMVTASQGTAQASAVVHAGPPVGSISLDQHWLKLRQGDERQLGVRLYEEGTGPRPEVEGLRLVTWHTDDPEVATVSATGWLEATGPGTTTLTVASEGRSDNTSVTVTGTVHTVRLRPGSVTIPMGDSATIWVDAYDILDQRIEQPVALSSSNSTVVSVHSRIGGQARLHAHAAGWAYIVGTLDGVRDSAYVQVIAPVATVEVRPDSARLALGGSLQFEAIARDARGGVLGDRAATWASSNLGVAHTTPTGMVTALGPGTTQVTATIEGVVGTAVLSVGDAPPDSGSWVTVHAGGSHSCGLRRDGTAHCWGSNSSGQLGTGTTQPNPRPAPVAGGLRYSVLDAGPMGSCGITQAGAGYCWGGSHSPLVTTPRLAASGPLRSVRTGDEQGCGLSPTGALHCWPFWYSGIPLTEHAGPFLDVNASPACVIDASGQVLCWTTRSAHLAPKSDAADSLVTLTGYNALVCALDAAGRAFCSSSFGSGPGSTILVGGLSPVAPSLRFRQISAGARQVCALDESGQAYCWTYLVGFMSAGRHDDPVAIGGDLRFAQISTGGAHACGVTERGAAYCWGDNALGQLGVGITGGTSTEPARVRDP
jgi:hypothetical protein